MSVAAKKNVTFPVEQVRADFPILSREMRGRPLVYLDSAASAQKPRAVLERLQRFYTEEYANVHRGVYSLSANATDAFEAVREKVKTFIHAAHSKEIVFVRGTTEAINLVAQCFVRPNLKAGDEILITGMEHHANIVPWQLLCDVTGAQLRVAAIDDSGLLNMESFRDALNERTRFVAIVHASNVLGTINPVKECIALAHERGIPVLVDGAQSAAHLPIDVQELGCDFFAFSSHKLCGPTGAGVLYGRYDHLCAMPPYQGGGDMILSVTFSGTKYQLPPQRFEAGTPAIAEVIGFGAALDYLQGLGLENIARYEAELIAYALTELRKIPGLRIIGDAEERVSVVSFLLEGVHAHDLGTILDDAGIAIRAGHHCAQPLMEHYHIPATARASLAFYNTFAEIDALCAELKKARELFHV